MSRSSLMVPGAPWRAVSLTFLGGLVLVGAWSRSPSGAPPSRDVPPESAPVRLRGPAAGGRVRLEVDAPVLVAWAAEPERTAWLPPGEALFPAPPPETSDWTLRWSSGPEKGALPAERRAVLEGWGAALLARPDPHAELGRLPRIDAEARAEMEGPTPRGWMQEWLPILAEATEETSRALALFDRAQAWESVARLFSRRRRIPCAREDPGDPWTAARLRRDPDEAGDLLPVTPLQEDAPEEVGGFDPPGERADVARLRWPPGGAARDPALHLALPEDVADLWVRLHLREDGERRVTLDLPPLECGGPPAESVVLRLAPGRLPEGGLEVLVEAWGPRRRGERPGPLTGLEARAR